MKALETTKTTARVEVQSKTIHLVGVVGNSDILHSNVGRGHMQNAANGSKWGIKM